jgi:hypothetical protein
MGKSEIIECPIFFPLTLCARFAELDQHRLLWMNGQTETLKPLRQYLHNPAGIFLQFKTNDKVVSYKGRLKNVTV